MKGLVLAGGKGLNMQPLSKDFPKVLLRVAGKPVIDYVLEGLISTGIDDLIVVVSDEQVEEHIIRKWGMYASVIYQANEGLEAAMLSASDYFKNHKFFFLAYGDIIAPRDFYKLVLNTYVNAGEHPVLSTVPVVDVESYGIAIVDGNIIADVSHEPSKLIKKSSYVLAGAYILPAELFNYLESDFTLPDALSSIVKKEKAFVAHWTGYWVDIGYPWDIIAANCYVLGDLKRSIISSKAQIASTAVIEGPVIIEENAVVDHNAVIKGPVYIGRGAFIGMNAFIRKYTSVEERAVVGAFSEIKRSSLQVESSAGSYSLIVDSVLGFRAVIEPRVTVLSALSEEKRILRELPLQGIIKKKRKLGVFMGPESRVKAGSVIQPFTLIDARSAFP
ncbi:MAG: hypothetical protein DRJ38_05480 [Thermoprotei archaeon]|nr:MAG: hypothetical protein DRJ38_05480 [Thermoprotei archaeon]